MALIDDLNALYKQQRTAWLDYEQTCLSISHKCAHLFRDYIGAHYSWTDPNDQTEHEYVSAMSVKKTGDNEFEIEKTLPYLYTDEDRTKLFCLQVWVEYQQNTYPDKNSYPKEPINILVKLDLRKDSSKISIAGSDKVHSVSEDDASFNPFFEDVVSQVKQWLSSKPWEDGITKRKIGFLL